MKLSEALPKPSPDALELSQALRVFICEMIVKANTDKGISHSQAREYGIPFSRFFDACLYTPNYGYYSNGLRKFGAAGDFITAPELSPAFSYCLANQILEFARSLTGGLVDFNIMEIGAGTGIMCADILDHLKSKESLPERYYILERSGTLRIQQHSLLKQRHPDYFRNIIWLDTPPQSAFEAIIIGNEIIDALAVDRFVIDQGIPYYLDVGLAQDACIDAVTELKQSDQFVWKKRTADSVLLDFIAHLSSNYIQLPEGYISEFCPQLPAFIRAITEHLTQGAVILIDYGYTQKNYYHPLRATGTLIAHYQHRAHEAFFELIGLQDLTANVDFTALAEAALASDLEILGFTSQALFLYGCGLEKILEDMHEKSSDLEWYSTAQKVQQLVLPAEMGERFSVMAFGKNIEIKDPMGFKLRDFRHVL